MVMIACLAAYLYRSFYLKFPLRVGLHRKELKASENDEMQWKECNLDEFIQLLYVFQFCVAVEKQGCVICVCQTSLVEGLEV